MQDLQVNKNLFSSFIPLNLEAIKSSLTSYIERLLIITIVPISTSFFKGFLSRAYKICSKRQIIERIEYLIVMFTANGYERKTLEKISKNYLNKLENRTRYE